MSDCAVNRTLWNKIMIFNDCSNSYQNTEQSNNARRPSDPPTIPRWADRPIHSRPHALKPWRPRLSRQSQSFSWNLLADFVDGEQKVQVIESLAELHTRHEVLLRKCQCSLAQVHDALAVLRQVPCLLPATQHPSCIIVQSSPQRS